VRDPTEEEEPDDDSRKDWVRARLVKSSRNHSIRVSGPGGGEGSEPVVLSGFIPRSCLEVKWVSARSNPPPGMQREGAHLDGALLQGREGAHLDGALGEIEGAHREGALGEIEGAHRWSMCVWGGKASKTLSANTS
jgi:hypothetical protein